MDYRFTFANSVDSDDSRSLADLLESSPKSSTSLSLQHRNLHSIGKLRSRYHMLQSLDLSNNALDSLRGLSVLTVLKTGIFSSNRLSSFKALGDLFELGHLTTLDLRSNKVTKLPSYRVTVLSSVPSLEYLDSQSVRAKDRKAAQRHRSLTDEVAKNEETYLRLEHLKSKLRVHRQMIISNFIIEYHGVNVDQFLKMVPYVHGCEEVKDWVSERMKEENSEFTLTDCIQDQHERIQELEGICKDLSKECNALFNTKYGEEDETITLFVPQRERRSASRVEMLDDRLNYVKIKNEDTNAIQNAIKEGINTVVERFVCYNLTKRVFCAMRKAASRCRAIGRLAINAREQRFKRIRKSVFQEWKIFCGESKEDKQLKLIRNKFSRREDSQDKCSSEDKSENESFRRNGYDKNYAKRYERSFENKYEDKSYDRKYEKGFDNKHEDKSYDRKYEKGFDNKYEDKSYDKKYEKGFDNKYEDKSYDRKYEKSFYNKYDKHYDKNEDKRYDRYFDKPNEKYLKKSHHETHEEIYRKSHNKSHDKFPDRSRGSSHRNAYDKSYGRQSDKNFRKSQEKTYNYSNANRYNRIPYNKRDRNFEGESANSSRSSEKKYGSVYGNSKYPSNYKLEMQKYEHERLLQYASFHRNKKMKSKIFQSWKDMVSSASLEKSGYNYRSINSRLNNLERSLNETKQELESSFHLRTMGAQSPVFKRSRDDFLNSSHNNPQNAHFRSFTPVRRPNTQMGHYSGTRNMNQHLEHRILNADRQVALRADGARLIDDIFQKLNTIENKLLVRHRIFY